MLWLNLDPAVLLGQVVELADFNAGDVFEPTLAIGIAADAVGHFAFLTRNPADLGNEFLPEFGDFPRGFLGKTPAKTGNEQEMPVLEAWLGRFDTCLLIHDSTP